MKINAKGLELIKHFEGCNLDAYQDAVGIWTIGYGSTLGVKKGQKISRSDADLLLEEDLNRFEVGVSKLTENKLNINQFSALVSFAFNLGLGNLQSSTLLKKIKEQDFNSAKDEFQKWNKAGGKVLAGLTKRRLAEAELFSTAPESASLLS